MVGKDAETMKQQRETFADSIKKFLGKPFSPSGFGPKDYGCLGFVYAFLCDQGKENRLTLEIPGGIDIWNYSQWYPTATREEILDALNAAFDVNGVEIPVGRQIAGDMVIVRTPQGDHYPAIYGGNGVVVASYWDAGVRTMKVTGDMKIIRVRRV